ncbi:MAG: hypothetical protein PHF86_14450 [Candidatus Nanoarchaeia archaeon]|jgi:hypothetical protein|nr:hypothetical protein [Candidatus Nanoarchaeia archaeon]
MKALTIEDVLKTKEDLESVLSNLFGNKLNVKLNFKIEESKYYQSKEEYLTVESEPIPRLGISAFIFSELRICSFGRIHILSEELIEETKIYASFAIHVSYRQQTGGSNRSDLGFNGKRIFAELIKNPNEWMKEEKEYKWIINTH